MDKWCKGRLVVISVYVSNMFPWSSFELPFTIWYSCVLLLSVSTVYTGAPWRWLQITDETHSSGSVHGRTQYDGAGQLKCDGTRAETRFRLSAKWMSPFKSAGVSVQSTAGSRRARIGGNNAGYTIFSGSAKGTGYPLHSPVSPSLLRPCITTCHHISTGG
jgi:hypothetical protein